MGEKFNPHNPELETVHSIEQKAPEAAPHFEDAPDIKTAEGKVLRGFVKKGVQKAENAQSERRGHTGHISPEEEARATEKLKGFENLNISRVYRSVKYSHHDEYGKAYLDRQSAQRAAVTAVYKGKQLKLNMDIEGVEGVDTVYKKLTQFVYDREKKQERFREELEKQAKKFDAVKDVAIALGVSKEDSAINSWSGDGGDYKEMFFAGSLDGDALDSTMAEEMFLKIVRLQNAVNKGNEITRKFVDKTSNEDIAKEVEKGDREREEARKEATRDLAKNLLAEL